MWLIALAVYGALVLPAVLSVWRQFGIEGVTRAQLPVFNFSIVGLSVIFVVAAWKWKKWGVFGIYSIAVPAAGIALALSSAAPIADWGFIMIPGFFGIALAFIAAKQLLRIWRWFEGKSKSDQQHPESVEISGTHRAFVTFLVILLLVTNSFSIGGYPMTDIISLAFGLHYTRGPGFVLTVIGHLTSIVFGIASATWKKWGFIGLGTIALMPVVAVIATRVITGADFLRAAAGYIGVGITGIVLLIILLRPVWRQLKWR